MRISAHFLHGDVKFFPCAPAVGASPSARRGEKRGAFRENVGAFRMDLADELTGVYEGRALWALTDEGAR